MCHRSTEARLMHPLVSWRQVSTDGHIRNLYYRNTRLISLEGVDVVAICARSLLLGSQVCHALFTSVRHMLTYWQSSCSPYVYFLAVWFATPSICALIACHRGTSLLRNGTIAPATPSHAISKCPSGRQLTPLQQSAHACPTVSRRPKRPLSPSEPPLLPI